MSTIVILILSVPMPVSMTSLPFITDVKMLLIVIIYMCELQSYMYNITELLAYTQSLTTPHCREGGGGGGDGG